MDVADLFSNAIENFQSFLPTSIDILRTVRTVRRSHVNAVPVD